MARYPWIRLFFVPLAMAVLLRLPFAVWPVRPAVAFLVGMVLVRLAFHKNRTELSLATCGLVWFIFGNICAFCMLPIAALVLSLEPLRLFDPFGCLVFWWLGITYWFMWQALEEYLPARLRSGN